MRSSHRIAFLAALTCFAAMPVAAADFTVTGSYWDTDVAGDSGIALEHHAVRRHRRGLVQSAGSFDLPVADATLCRETDDPRI